METTANPVLDSARLSKIFDNIQNNIWPDELKSLEGPAALLFRSTLSDIAEKFNAGKNSLSQAQAHLLKYLMLELPNSPIIQQLADHFDITLGDEKVVGYGANEDEVSTLELIASN